MIALAIRATRVALPPPVRIARDTLLALAIALPLAALGVSLFLSSGARVSRTRSIALAIGAAVLAAASLGGSVRAADPNASPCPATAPVKTFDVQAINVDQQKYSEVNGILIE